MTTLIIPLLDTLSGERLINVEVTIHRVVRLTCGCDRIEAGRPGGGHVHIIQGAHCEGLAA